MPRRETVAAHLSPISIRFAATERTVLERAAKADGFRFGSWVREVALLAAARGIRVKQTGNFEHIKAKHLSPISVRFTDAERATLEKAAKADGLRFGSWVREVALLAAGRGMRVKRTVEFKRTYRTRENAA